MTTANDILEFSDIKESTIEIPEWGNKKLLIRGMDGNTTYDVALQMQKEKQFNVEMVAKIVIACTYDPETKQRVFSDTHAKALMTKNFSALMRIVNEAAGLSGFDMDVSKDQVIKN